MLNIRKERMNIVVTGASSGIGYEVVLALSKVKTNHVIAVARSEEKLKELKEVCMNLNGNVIDIYVADLADEKFSASFSRFIAERFQKVHVLLNNAGALINKSFEETTSEEIHYIYKVNVFAAMEMVKSLSPYFEQGKTHVVNIGSMGGYQGSAKFPGLSIYSSAKAALASLTECLAEEYKDKGIKFNCLSLGAVQTEMLESAFPTFKAPIDAEQMASFIADFCINGGKFFNGKIVPVSLSTP